MHSLPPSRQRRKPLRRRRIFCSRLGGGASHRVCGGAGRAKRYLSEIASKGGSAGSHGHHDLLKAGRSEGGAVRNGKSLKPRNKSTHVGDTTSGSLFLFRQDYRIDKILRILFILFVLSKIPLPAPSGPPRLCVPSFSLPALSALDKFSSILYNPVKRTEKHNPFTRNNMQPLNTSFPPIRPFLRLDAPSSICRPIPVPSFSPLFPTRLGFSRAQTTPKSQLFGGFPLFLEIAVPQSWAAVTELRLAPLASWRENKHAAKTATPCAPLSQRREACPNPRSKNHPRARRGLPCTASPALTARGCGYPPSLSSSRALLLASLLLPLLFFPRKEQQTPITPRPPSHHGGASSSKGHRNMLEELKELIVETCEGRRVYDPKTGQLTDVK